MLKFIRVEETCNGKNLFRTLFIYSQYFFCITVVVLLGGAAATIVKGRGALQDIDQLSVLQPIVKYAATCTSVRDIVPTLRRAFNEAQSGVPGPPPPFFIYFCRGCL